MGSILTNKFSTSFINYRHIAPLVTLRIVFGAIMFFSIVRFLLKGWVNDFYVCPNFHFTYYGFGWVKPLGEIGMYFVFGTMIISTICITIGLFYRFSCLIFFISFTYIELIDKTYYLNHYYFISIITFLLILVPAHRYFSVDVIRKPRLKVTHVPSWTITIFKLQLLIVYFLAGFAKLNTDWLMEAMPLKIWLPANSHLPFIGHLLEQEWIAYFFSWFGALFDLTIVFFLIKKSTRIPAYFTVILFHVFTAWFFKIGMFPYIMMSMTIIFFSENFHVQLIGKIQSFFEKKKEIDILDLSEIQSFFIINFTQKKILFGLLTLHFILQVLIPFRYLLYPENLFWTEEGYRFSWRVMLMEKGGTSFFYVKDAATGRNSEIVNADFLTPMQEKMMTTQPDMILQYAHYLGQEYHKKGIQKPIVTADIYVTLNGAGTRPFIDNKVDLIKEKETFLAKKWILPFNNNQEKK